MAQILIYVGGILALLLFGVMLTPPDLGERKLSRVLGAHRPVGGAMLFVALQVGRRAGRDSRLGRCDGRCRPCASDATEIGVAFLAPEQYVVAFELAAFVLTVALVAAVYIARRRRGDLEPASSERRTTSRKERLMGLSVRPTWESRRRSSRSGSPASSRAATSSTC